MNYTDIVDVLKKSGRPMKIKELVSVLDEPYENIACALSRDKRFGTPGIKHLEEQGTWIYNSGPSEPTELPVKKATNVLVNIQNLLKKEGRPLRIVDIVKMLDAPYAQISMALTNNTLSGKAQSYGIERLKEQKTWQYNAALATQEITSEAIVKRPSFQVSEVRAIRPSKPVPLGDVRPRDWFGEQLKKLYRKLREQENASRMLAEEIFELMNESPA